MKYVNRIEAKGVARLYFRKKDHPRNGELLRSPWPEVQPGSALEAEVEAILASVPSAPKVRIDNLARAIRDYELSPEFTGKAMTTKRGYLHHLRHIEREFGAHPISHFTSSRNIRDMRNHWALRGYKVANDRLQMLRLVLTPVLADNDLNNPFTLIGNVDRPADMGEPHIIWPEAVLHLVIEEALRRGWFGLARGVALGRYSGARCGDIVRMRQTHRQGGRIAWLSGKKKVPVNQIEDPLLTQWLDKLPAEQPRSRWQRHAIRQSRITPLPPSTIVFNTRNRVFTESGLSQALAKVVVRLHAKGLIDSDQYNLHGLRHTFATEGALAGWSEVQGAVMMGHKTTDQFADYVRQANRLHTANAATALMATLRASVAGTAPEQEVQNECKKVQNEPGDNIVQLAKMAL